MITTTLKYYVYYYCSIFINKFEQIEYPLLNVCFVEFEQVNIYLWKFDVWSIKLFDSFIVIYYDCVRGMVTSFIRYLFKSICFFVFQIRMKNEKQTSNLNFNVQLFGKSKNHLFWCFLSQLQYRNENQNLISNFIFQFIKKNEMALWVRIQVDAITSSYGLSQLVCEPTHILPNLSLCIDLIFINQDKFTRNSGVYTSLHPNFHHPIVYAKLNSKIEYPPHYMNS